MSMIKTKVTIQFPSLASLWAFRSHVSLSICEIIVSSNLLICDCSVEEIQEAVTKYKGKVIQVVDDIPDPIVSD